MTTNTPSGSEPVSVRLVGGPADWHEQTLDIYTAEDLAAPREELGTYLISEAVPAGHPDPAARADYSPNYGDWPVTLWFFRGWIPYSPWDPEAGSAEHHHPVEMTVDGDGLPARWVDHTGQATHTVDRVLVHWQSTGEAIDSPDVWQVEATSPHGSGVWELRWYVGGSWEAGPLHVTTS